MSQSNYLTAPLPSTRMPGGIPYIVGNEAAERFSFYGMKAILTVFMTEHLMSQGDKLAPMSDADAKFWVHTFVVAAYFFPLIGALVSDWLLGKYHTILSLSIVYCLGHLALALDETRVGLTIGLTLIAMGTGAIKPCVSAHVGDQFGRQNQHLLTKVFGWFYLAINLGAFLSTVATPLLLVTFGPHVAFGVPGLLMLIATIVFWMGRHKFVHVPPRGRQFLRDSFSGEGLSAIGRLLPIYVFVAAFWCLFDQTASAWVLQAKEMNTQTNLGFTKLTLLPSQIQAANPFLILVLVPLFAYVVYPAIDKVFPLSPLRKISIGMFVAVGAFGISTAIESNITGGRIVMYKLDPSDSSFESTSSADATDFGPRNLLDEAATGWISRAADEGELGTQYVAIRLREHRAWNVGSISISPLGDLEPYFETRRKDDAKFEPPPAESYAPEHIEVFTGDSPAGPWTSQGTMSPVADDEATELSFPPVTAGYVLLKIEPRAGAEAVALDEVRVLAAESAPPNGGALLSEVWPNVAATGFKPHIMWQFLAYVVLTAAEVMVSITCLEFSYTQAPNSMKSVIMSLYLLSVAAGNEFTAVVNALIERPDGTTMLPGAAYYAFFTGVMAVAAIGFVFVAMLYRGKTYIQDEQEAALDEAEARAEGTGDVTL